MDKKNFSDFADNLKEAFENIEDNEDVAAMKESAKEIADTATELIRKYPLQSVIGAAVIGFALGSLLNRRK
jgi:ElaB/YqjD/DUF883 family membrane-anchored ribosome-binding protein